MAILESMYSYTSPLVSRSSIGIASSPSTAFWSNAGVGMVSRASSMCLAWLLSAARSNETAVASVLLNWLGQPPLGTPSRDDLGEHVGVFDAVRGHGRMNPLPVGSYTSRRTESSCGTLD